MYLVSGVHLGQSFSPKSSWVWGPHMHVLGDTVLFAKRRNIVWGFGNWREELFEELYFQQLGLLQDKIPDSAELHLTSQKDPIKNVSHLQKYEV